MNEHILQEKIIKPAWDIASKDLSLKKIYFLPGLLSTIFFTGVLIYQAIYTYVELLGGKEELIKIMMEFFKSGYMIGTLIFLVIFLLFYFLGSPVFEGSLIYAIDQKSKDKKCSFGDSVGHGLHKFLPMFEYSNIFSEFKFISLINLYLFSLRFTGIEYIKYVSYIFVFLFIVSSLVNVFFFFAKYIIIIEEKKAFAAISRSSFMAILNLGLTIRLYMLMFMINIRVILNFILFLLFPIAVVASITYITSQVFFIIAIIILSIVFIILICLLAYLTTVLDIFKTAIGYNAYNIAKSNMEGR